jgi:hypothetical protein
MLDVHDLCWVIAAILLAMGGALLFWWRDFEGMRSAWEYYRRIRQRLRLGSDEFYRRYYAASGIPADLVFAVRDFHASYFGEDPELLRPEDDLFAINAGIDCATWFAEARTRFGVIVPVTFTPELRAALPRLDQSFDTVVRCIHLLQAHHVRSEPATGTQHFTSGGTP